MARVLVLFAHPAIQRSRANRALRAAIEGLDGVTVHDLYEAYPDFLLDVEREQALLVGHDALVVQHPFYWYSAPAHVKEWQDLVLTHGFAYGAGARALSGKPWLQAITAGGSADEYRPDGANRFSVEELLRPFEATANLCGALWQAPHAVLGAPRLDAPALQAEAHRYRARIEALRDRSIQAAA